MNINEDEFFYKLTDNFIEDDEEDMMELEEEEGYDDEFEVEDTEDDD